LQLKATPDFNWKPCFDNFTCTKLQVPLDYDNEAAGTTDIAFIRWSTNVTSAANSTQDILLNPGGPGGSGISYLLDSLPQLLEQFGPGYNLVSFDPRGVGASGPNVSCFPGETGTGRMYSYDLFRTVDVDDEKSLREAYAKSGAFGDFCSQAHSAENDPTKYVNTIATATDMLHYTELLAKSKGQDPTSSELWYYGVSYGTLLGTTFAALFPDRVGRMIVDGVVDGEDYYAGQWRSNLFDADAGVRYFFKSCHEAGKNGSCEFWDESPEAIEKRYHAIMDDIANNPISVSDSQTPAIVTTSHIKAALQQVPYSPLISYPIFAKALAELETRNTTTLKMFSPVGLRTDDCSANPSLSEQNLESLFFIGCNDANRRHNLSTYDSWVEEVNYLYNQSQFIGEAWATSIAINCRKLDVKAPASQVFEGYPGASNTKNPLLFVSTKIDPVTPLRSAKKMTARFDGARLLVQDSVGHASLSSPSKCTYGHFQQYMKDASLPDEGTVCTVDKYPFDVAASLDASAKMLRKRSFL
jgi:pimeloyl-ACP methyl ester carboxylesterase